MIYGDLSQLKGDFRMWQGTVFDRTAGSDSTAVGEPCRVLFLLQNLEMGGAERVVCHLLEGLDRTCFEPHLAVLDGDGPLRDWVPSDVPLHDLKTRRASRSPWAVCRLIWRLRPQRVMTSGPHMCVLLGFLRPFLPRDCRLIVRESNVVSCAFGQSRGQSFIRLAQIAYRLVDRVIAQTQRGAIELRDLLHLPEERISQIYNPVPFDEIESQATAGVCPFLANDPGPNIVGVGRLSPV
jgi:hypothetical protein